MFAGKMATSITIMSHAATALVATGSNNNANNISMTPLA